MIELPTNETDAAEFIHRISQIINDEISKCNPEEIYLIKIDHAFDHKWLGYSGNPRQHVGVWKDLLTIPPFHPNRVVSQLRFHRDSAIPPAYESDGPGKSLHLLQPSSENLKSYLRDISTSALFIWYSGETAKSGRGTLMIYYNLPNFSDKWLATFERDYDWKIVKHRTISVAAE